MTADVSPQMDHLSAGSWGKNSLNVFNGFVFPVKRLDVSRRHHPSLQKEEKAAFPLCAVSKLSRFSSLSRELLAGFFFSLGSGLKKRTYDFSSFNRCKLLRGN